MSTKLILPKQTIIQFLEEGHTIKHAVKQFGYSENTLRRNGIYAPKNKAGYTKYNKKFDYFKQIDSQNKAYILGLLMADGCIKHTYELSIESKDIELVTFVKQELCPDFQIRKIERDRKHLKSISKTYYFGLKCKIWYEDLQQYNIVPRKTYVENLHLPNNIPFKYLRSYLRGYFDGDGSIYSTGSQVCVAFTGNTKLLESVKQYLSIFDIGVNCSVRQKSNQFDGVYKFSAREDVSKFYSLIYEDAEMFLPRKYQRFIDLARLKPLELLEKPEEVNQQRSLTGM